MAGPPEYSRKAEWPDWTPPPEMIARQPYLPRFMAGGPGNPLGARAMYLGSTVYRIHGTDLPDTIGTEVSSGCFRLVNADVPISSIASRSAPRSLCGKNRNCDPRLRFLGLLSFPFLVSDKSCGVSGAAC